MKRIFALMAALVLCVGVLCPIAVSAVFTPSVSYKDAPDVDDAVLGEEGGEPIDIGPCLIITSVLAAKNKTTDIHQDERDLLLEVYEKISDGSMKLPIPENYVVRDLLDIDFAETTCIIPVHEHMEYLDQHGVIITVEFDLGVKAEEELLVLSYHDGEWKSIKRWVNNGDGTVTCEFEHFCPVAFCVEMDNEGGPSQTGDTMGNMFYVWVAVLVVSMAALIVLLVLPKLRRK